ncbi:glycosyl transferase group 1 [Methylorubrum extorquens CM4]|uniref:Glycosyl transferase group 1 n=1 Tax=Methylorubrum extorquens (strain CM4 / NCIMB 13688) TaxID=440085 RepID=B7L194_METC4|nr:glycosyl transferase group 1 [Methylorubrum extorquens CM4]
MRILFVLPFPLTRDAGAAGVLLELGDHLSRRGWQVEYLAPKSNGILSERWISVTFPLFVLLKLSFTGQRYDIIDSFPGSCGLYFSAFRKRKSLFVTFSQMLLGPFLERSNEKSARDGVSMFRLMRRRYALWLEHISISRCDVFLALNEEERSYATDRYNIAPDRTFVVGNGIAGHFFCVPRKKRVSRKTVRRIVQIGSYEPRKGVDVTRDALAPIMAEFPDLELWFLGTRTSEEKVHSDFPKNIRSRITVIPEYCNDELPEVIASCDILIFPSLYEAFGLAPLEAMACGLPVIVSDAAGPKQYAKSEVNSLVVRAGDAQALSDAVRRLLDNASLFQLLQNSGYETVLDYRWADVTDRRIAIYRGLMSSGS